MMVVATTMTRGISPVAIGFVYNQEQQKWEGCRRQHNPGLPSGAASVDHFWDGL